MAPYYPFLRFANVGCMLASYNATDPLVECSFTARRQCALHQRHQNTNSCNCYLVHNRRMTSRYFTLPHAFQETELLFKHCVKLSFSTHVNFHLTQVTEYLNMISNKRVCDLQIISNNYQISKMNMHYKYKNAFHQ